MRRTWSAGLGLLALALVGASVARADPGNEAATLRARAVAQELEADLVGTVARVRGATVSILSHAARSTRGGRLDRPRPLRAVGTGVLIEYEGRLAGVLTSLHVVDTPDLYEVITADGAAHRITIQARDPDADLAFLAFRVLPEGLHGIDVATQRVSTSRPAKGAWVLATGNPFFLALDGDSAVSLGVVSGERPAEATHYIHGSILQHDAEINPGSSGGPLWDTSGHLLGINGTIATRSRAQGAGPAYTGASFAVPMDRARAFLLKNLSSSTPLPRLAPRSGVAIARQAPPPVVRSVPFLRIRTRTQVGGRGAPVGARVTGVSRPGGAPLAGDRLRPGDVITRFAASGRAWKIRSAGDVQSVMAGLPTNTIVTLRYVRGGEVRGWTGRLAAGR